MIVTKNEGNSYIDMFHWDADRQQLLVDYWPDEGAHSVLQIVPGVKD
jgi:hypothetical protein